MRDPGWSSARGRVLLALACVLLTLAAGELGLRWLLPQPLDWDPSAAWEPVEGLGSQRKVGLDLHVNTGDREVRLRTDARRHRVGDAPPGDSELHVLALGDSFVDALQVEYEETMTALLAVALSQALGRRTEVVNAGLGGRDPNHYRLAAELELEQQRYDAVLVFVFVENDVVDTRVESFPPNSRISPPRFSSDAGLAANLRVLGLRVRGFLAARSQLYVYTRNLWELRRIRSGERRRHFLNAMLRAEAGAPAWALTADVLASIAERAAADGTPTLFVLIPSHHAVDEETLRVYAAAVGVERSELDPDQPTRILGAELTARGLPVLDATPRLRREFASGERELYGRLDKHFAAAGHRVMAELLTPAALELLGARAAAR